MSGCPYLVKEVCQVSTTLTSDRVVVEATEESCRKCEAQAAPRSANRVTCGRAVLALQKAGIVARPELITCAAGETVKGTVGTHLKKLISWFVWDKNASDCLKCANRAQTMNLWGAKGCRQNEDVILAWLEESAEEFGMEYNSAKARFLLRIAIARGALNESLQRIKGG